MQLSRSAYYQWQKPIEGSKSKDQSQLEQQVITVFKEHKRRYGIRRMCAALKDRGLRAGKYKCRALMKKHGLQAIQPRSFVPRTTQSQHPYAFSPNLLLDRSAPIKPDEVWVGDITYLTPQWRAVGLSSCMDGSVLQTHCGLATGRPYARRTGDCRFEQSPYDPAY